MARLTPGAIDTAMLGSILNRARTQAAADPFSNPILLFALDLTLRMDRGEIDLDGLETVVQQLTAEAFADRAERLKNYLGETAIAANEQATRGADRAKGARAASRSFARRLPAASSAWCSRLIRRFRSRWSWRASLAELATGQTVAGVALDQAGRDERMEAAMRVEHRPPAELTLEVEHAWVTEALNHAHDALEGVHRTALRVAREHWPEQWTGLEPRLVTLASWVGYDQDGRTDITWTRTIAARLADKLAMIERYRGKVEATPARRRAVISWRRWNRSATMLATASATVARQMELLAAAERDPARTAAFGRAMVSGREHALVETAPLVALIERALAGGARRRAARGAVGDARQPGDARPGAGAYPCAAQRVAIAQRGAAAGGTRDGAERSGESALVLQHHQRPAGAGAAAGDQLRIADGGAGVGQAADDDGGADRQVHRRRHARSGF